MVVAVAVQVEALRLSLVLVQIQVALVWVRTQESGILIPGHESMSTLGLWAVRALAVDLEAGRG